MRIPWLSRAWPLAAVTFWCGVAEVPLAKAATVSIFDQISQEVQAVFEKASPAVVKVRALGGPKPLAGTGFFIDNKGTVLTSYAVIGESSRAWIELKNEKIEAKIVGRDARSGVAVLKVESDEPTPFLKFGDTTKLKVASALISVAYPYNLDATPAFGLITGFNPSFLNQFFATSHIRASLDISPGQIGGPVLNTRGEVIGVLMIAVQNNRECFILPINAAQKIIRDFEQFGEPRHGWVGVGVTEDKGTIDPVKPVRVSQLFENTPAVKSGIKSGDKVLQVAGRPIQQPSDVLDVAFFAKVGEDIPVVVERDGKKMSFTIKVVERPADSRMVEPLRPLNPKMEPSDSMPVSMPR